MDGAEDAWPIGSPGLMAGNGVWVAALGSGRGSVCGGAVVEAGDVRWRSLGSFEG